MKPLIVCLILWDIAFPSQSFVPNPYCFLYSILSNNTSCECWPPFPFQYNINAPGCKRPVAIQSPLPPPHECYRMCVATWWRSINIMLCGGQPLMHIPESLYALLTHSQSSPSSFSRPQYVSNGRSPQMSSMILFKYTDFTNPVPNFQRPITTEPGSAKWVLWLVLWIIRPVKPLRNKHTHTQSHTHTWLI